MKTWYAWATPSGPIHLIEGDKMPVRPDRPGNLCRVTCGQWLCQCHLYADQCNEYESALQAAKESSIPVQDQERAKKMIELLLYEKRKELTFQDISSLDIMPNVIYGPFTVEYRIDEVFSHCTVGEKHYVKVAILYDDTPEKETQEVSITVSKSAIPKNARLVEAYETEHRIIVMFAAGEEIPEDHNCDWMGCGSFSHVKYILTKPDSSL